MTGKRKGKEKRGNSLVNTDQEKEREKNTAKRGKVAQT